MAILNSGAPMNIANGVREFARATPDADAVIDGDRKLSYSALHDRSNRVANTLLARGLKVGDRVAFMCGNRLEYPEVAAGVAKAGMVMVPINPRSTAEEAAFIVGHSGARALIADEAAGDSASAAAEEGEMLARLAIGGSESGASYERALAASPAVDPCFWIDETEPFVIAYTSGTTGAAKGVMISHRSRCLTFYCTALEWGLGPGRLTTAVSPMHHGGGFAFAYAALHTGGTLAMLDGFDPERFLALVQRHRVHSAFLVPTHARILRDLGEAAMARFDLSSLETLYFNAAAFPHDLKLWTLDTFPHVGLHELYGSTEAAVVTNLRPEDQRRKPQCVGPPWFMNEVRILDDEGEPVAPGAPGELFSRSPFLMNGYYRDPEATAAATTEDGFFSAGDVAVADDENFIYIVDRKKDVIITGGVNVYPREVEEVLMRHPAVRDAAVVGTPSKDWGEAVAAVLVMAPGADTSDEDLDAWCRRYLSRHKIPRRYQAVDELPRNPAGKILKRRIRDGLL